MKKKYILCGANVIIYHNENVETEESTEETA